MRRKTIIPIILVCLFLVACASFTKNTYRSLFIAGTTYDAVMKSVKSLQVQGKITYDQRLQINRFGEIYYNSYMMACDAFKLYEKTKSETAKQQLIKIIPEMMANWGTFAGYINSIIANTAPPSIEELRDIK